MEDLLMAAFLAMCSCLSQLERLKSVNSGNTCSAVNIINIEVPRDWCHSSEDRLVDGETELRARVYFLC